MPNDAYPDRPQLGRTDRQRTGRRGDGDPERSEELVEDLLAGRADADDADATTAALLRLRAVGEDPVPSDVRARHLARIRTYEPVHGGRVRPSGRSRRVVPRRHLVPVVAAAVSLLMVAGGGTVALAQDATPDDALYGIKRASEQAWRVLPRGSDRAAELHLTLADRRLDEARKAPRHAERLISEGAENVEAAADGRPEEAIESFLRLLGDGPDRLPDNAAPMARSRIHRNCVRIATKHDLGPERCGDAPDDQRPGGGRGRGLADDQDPGRGLGRSGDTEPRGWGSGGRPEGETGPPHDLDVPRGHGWGPGGRPEGETGPPHDLDVSRGHGWGPGGRPEGETGPPRRSPRSELEPVPSPGG